MPFSDTLLKAGADVWAAQKDHPFVRELAAGTLDEAAFEHWLKQDYRYLLDYARLFAIAGTKASTEETMSHLLGVAHRVLNHEMDLHREFAADYGISDSELEGVEKAPTCVAYTNFLLRTAYTQNRRNTTAFRPWICAVTQWHLPPIPAGLDIPRQTHILTYSLS